jgi:hypothetical protein
MTPASSAIQLDPLDEFESESAAPEPIPDPPRAQASIAELPDRRLTEVATPAARALRWGILIFLAIGLVMGARSRFQRTPSVQAQSRDAYRPGPGAPAPDPVLAAPAPATPDAPSRPAGPLGEDAAGNQPAAPPVSGERRPPVAPSRPNPQPELPRRVENRSDEPTAPPAMPAPEASPVQPPQLTTLIVGAVTAAPTVPPPAPNPISIVPAPANRSDVDAALRTVSRYGDALTRMDVKGAAQVWPSVDRRALSDAFRTLEKNHVAFNACAVEVAAGDTAVATCRASIEYVPKVGVQRPHLTAQQWRFTMKRVVGDWQIQSATAFEER